MLRPMIMIRYLVMLRSVVVKPKVIGTLIETRIIQ
jgi:hypothetical protein